LDSPVGPANCAGRERIGTPVSKWRVEHRQLVVLVRHTSSHLGNPSSTSKHDDNSGVREPVGRLGCRDVSERAQRRPGIHRRVARDLVGDESVIIQKALFAGRPGDASGGRC
jgi:hypothetical protein